MKLIPLTRGKFAMVDDEDYQWLSAYKWFAYPGGRTWYAAKIKVGTKIQIAMHQMLLFGGDQIDHWDHNGLNNMKANLRFADQCTNSRNMRKALRPTSSRFKGVSWHRARNKWSVRITTMPGAGSGPRRPWVGHFDDQLEAARAYDEAAREYFGAFAHVNFP